MLKDRSHAVSSQSASISTEPCTACVHWQSAPRTTWCDRTVCDDTEGLLCACRYSQHPRLRLLRRWRMPTEEDIGEGGLPCEGYPSDHISLCAVFEIS